MRRPSSKAAIMPLILLLAAACSDPQVQEDTSPTRTAQVRTLTLQPETWTQTIRTFGVFEAAEEVDLAVDFSATVRRVSFREGGQVDAGQTLLELDRGERELLVSRAARNVENVKAQLDRARQDLRRTEDLFAVDAITREDYDRSRAEVRSLSARYGEALAAQRLAERDLGETTLASPVSGRVVRRRVEPGETVMPGQVLGVVQTADTLRVVTFVSERDINALRVGGPARVSTPGVRGREYPARVESLAAEADPATGNFPVKLTVANDDGLLRSGMTARVELEGLEYGEVILIPSSATIDRQRRRVVYTVAEGKAVEVEPVLAATLGERLPVLTGLEPGDVLVVDGLEGLVDGSAVEVMSEP